jgi:hypothetical protein
MAKTLQDATLIKSSKKKKKEIEEVRRAANASRSVS